MQESPQLDDRLLELGADFRSKLIQQTYRVAGTREHSRLSVRHVDQAYKELLDPGEPAIEVRTAKQIVDAAISENLFGTYVLYTFAILFVVVGIAVVAWGALQREPILAVVGAVLSNLCWPAMTSARRTRKENIFIRLLEAPLAEADTAPEAANTIRGLFKDLFRNQGEDG